MAEVQDAIAQLSAEDQQYVDQASCLPACMLSLEA